ncbi:MAG: hypothetical protein ABSA33_05520 [Candidatus Micrarchaeaceae archaeon]
MVSKSVLKDRSVDIPQGVLWDVTTHMSYLYQQEEGKVVVLGGRAVNLYCSISARPTQPTDYFELSGDMLDGPRSKLIYRSSQVEKPIEIDLYYQHYSTRSGLANHSISIGDRIRVPIAAIASETETINFGDMDFTVPKLHVLLIMKYNALLGRGKEEDREDMKSIIRNHGNDTKRFLNLMFETSGFMERYIPDKKIEVMNGIYLEMQNWEKKDISPEVKALANKLIDRKRLLRTGN